MMETGKKNHHLANTMALIFQIRSINVKANKVKYKIMHLQNLKVQSSSVSQLCPTLCDPMDYSPPGLPVHHQLLELAQIHVHWVGGAIQPSHPLSSPSPPAPNPSQHESFPMSQLFTWSGQSTGVSALASFLPKKSQGWSPSEWKYYLKLLWSLL